MFGILIDQGPGTAPYQGITPIDGGSLADCAETYFAQSEQLPTRFALAIGEAVEPGGEAHWRAGGVTAPAHAEGVARGTGGAPGRAGCWPPRTLSPAATPRTGGGR